MRSLTDITAKCGRIPEAAIVCCMQQHTQLGDATVSVDGATLHCKDTDPPKQREPGV